MRGVTTINDYLEDMFRDINRFTVGFEPTFKMFDNVRNTAHNSYPPYDLEKIDDNKYRLSMAVAGFKSDEIDITLHDGVLTIEGKNEKDNSKNYLYKGIAGRNFKRVFYLNTYVEVKDTSLEDGILIINFEYELPESMKPRKISIDNGSSSKLLETK